MQMQRCHVQTCGADPPTLSRKLVGTIYQLWYFIKHCPLNSAVQGNESKTK